MKVGVIGLGWMGKVHLRAYHGLPGIEVVGVADVSREALDDVSGRYDVPVYGSVGELLAGGVDAVSVCVPTSMHLEVGLEVIRAGVSLLMEKPLAASAEEGERLVRAAEEARVVLMVGHIERFNPAVLRVRELIEAEEAGGGSGIISVSIERVGPYPPRISDVGVIRDLGSHDIDLLRFLTGSECQVVHAVTSVNLGAHEDTAIITARMDNGVLGQINVNWLTPYKSRRIHVATKSRFITADLISQQVREYSRFTGYDQSYIVREWPTRYAEPVVAELTSFLGAVRGEHKVAVSGQDGLKVLEIIERAMASIGSGCAA